MDLLARQITVSQGTFLEHLRLRAAKTGYQAEISLFPSGEYDEGASPASLKSRPVAEIKLNPARPVESPLYRAMFIPDTNRGPPCLLLQG